MYSKNSKYSPQSNFKPQVLYIFGNLRQNPVKWRWPQLPLSPSGTSGRWMMSSKYGKVPDKIFCLTPKYYIFLETSCKIKFNEDEPNHHDLDQEPQEDWGHPYFWNPQAKSTSMKITPTFMITIRNLSMMEDVFQVLGDSKIIIAQLSSSSSSNSNSSSSQLKLSWGWSGPKFQSCSLFVVVVVVTFSISPLLEP